MNDGESVIVVEQHDRVRRVVLNRPQKLNAMDPPMFAAFFEAIDAAVADPDTHAIIIAGAGRAFSSGADVSPDPTGPSQAARKSIGHAPADMAVTRARMTKWLDLWSISKPLIAQVQGYCIGAANEIVGCCDLVICGESARFGETAGRLGYAGGRRIPVLMAASGPKAIEVAGEVADGVLLLVGSNRGIVQRALELLERGARRAGRKVEDLEVIWAVRTAALPTTAEALRQARPTSVHWGILRWGGYWLEPAGLKLPPLTIPDAVWKIYPDLSHAHDWEAAIAATSFVPDEVVAQLCEAMGLIGTAEDCAVRIAELTKLGVQNLYLMPLETFTPPVREIAAFRDTVFPRLAAAGLR